MTLYWPAFEFTYTLDMRQLLPHLAAIESHNAARQSGIHPPPWRARPLLGSEYAPLNDSPSQPARVREIQLRKEELVKNNSSHAHAWLRERFAPGSPPLAVGDILTMHRLVAEESGIRYENVGVFRKDGQRVIVGEAQIGVHAGAPARTLPRLMAAYVQFVNSESQTRLPAAIHALVAHFFLTTIHPFEDGSGRVSRLVAAGLMFQRGYRGHGFYAFSNYFYENEHRYHSLIYETQQTPVFDLTRFVAFGLEGLVLELRGIQTFLKMKVNRAAERAILTPGLRRKAEPGNPMEEI
jgi:Fic family protein